MNKTELFINKSKEIFDDKFIYDNVEYVNNKTNVELICKEHGSFSVRPDSHLSKKYGCKECGIIKRTNIRKNSNWYSDCIKVHGYRYDYSLVNYINSKTKVSIICKEHGVFNMILNAHITQKHNCPKCHRVFDTNDFITKSKIIHNNFYDYSNSIYVNAREKIDIICNKHNKFMIQPYLHLQGQGCPKCKMSKGESKINNVLTNLNIKFECQKTFSDCISENKLKFDFYLTEKNICIEYDGEQHFRPIEYFGGENSFNKLKERDNIKNVYCVNNNIILLRIPYSSYNDIEYIIKKATK